MKVYRIFDLSFACTFPIEGLTVLAQRASDWRVEVETQALPEYELEWFHSWKDPNGDEVMACAHHGEAYLLRFSGLACFTIDFNSRRVSVSPENRCPESTLAHLLIDQVIPRILGHQGRMVVHASAVEISKGHAVAFTGTSGRGKSTLATAFFSAGYSLLSDDCLLLENRDGAVYAMASYPSLRLWPDSADAVVNESSVKGARYSEMAHYTSKRQLLFEGGGGSASPHWVKLSRLYLLEGGSANAGSNPVEITAAGGMTSIMALIEALFTLDVVSEKSVRRNFDVVRRVSGGVIIKRVMYPRSYEALPEVIEAVERDCRASAGGESLPSPKK